MPSKKTSEKEDTEKKTPEKESDKDIKDTSDEQVISEEKRLPKRSNPKCKCKQKKNRKFYGFELQGGRWIQISGVPFETQEECEENCCE